MKIERKGITHAVANWFSTEQGDDYLELEVGKNGVEEMCYCVSDNYGEHPYVQVISNNGTTIEEFFNVNAIKYIR